MTLVEYSSSDSEAGDDDDATGSSLAASVQQREPASVITRSARGESTPHDEVSISSALPADSGALTEIIIELPESFGTQQVVPGEWLCHVFVPVSLNGNTKLRKVLKKARRRIDALGEDEPPSSDPTEGFHWLLDSPESDDGAADGDADLHISLSQPITIRAGERKSFVGDMTKVLEQFHRFSISFASFTVLRSDASTSIHARSRSFLAAEIGQGYDPLRSITQALNSKLGSLYQGKSYFTEPRFHASIAWWWSSESKASSGFDQRVTQAANERCSQDLRDSGEAIVRHCVIRVGKVDTIVYLKR